MPHAHPCFVIAVTELGGSEFKSRGKTDMANKEKLLVFNPSEPHSGRMGGSKRWRYRSFYLGEQSTKHLMSMLGLEQTGHFITNTIHDPKLIDSFLKLHHSLEEKDEPSDPMGQQEMFIHSFGNLFQSHAQKKIVTQPANLDGQLLAPVIELLNDTYAERLTLENMAATAGLTLFQLIGAFKRTTGLTPHMYLTHIRLRAAVRRLSAGSSLLDAAITSGFYDQSALTRHFKRAYGITPLQFARAHKQTHHPPPHAR
jgi:AraC-like DNA-binding protein